MARMNWETVNKRDRARGSQPLQKQATMRRFVAKHGIVCFKCGTARPLQWAKTGKNTRGPWAICGDCVSSPRTFAEGFASAAAEQDYKWSLGDEVARRLRADRDA